jgi:hypothetical protein
MHSAHTVYLLLMSLKVNSDYFPKQSYIGDALCFLYGTKRIVKIISVAFVLRSVRGCKLHICVALTYRVVSQLMALQVDERFLRLMHSGTSEPGQSRGMSLRPSVR